MKSRLPILPPAPTNTGNQQLDTWALHINRAIQRMRDRYVEPTRLQRRRIAFRRDQLDVIREEENTAAEALDVYVEPGKLQVIEMGVTSCDFVDFKLNGNTHQATDKITIANGNSLFAYYEVNDLGTVWKNTVELVQRSSDFSDFPHWRPQDPEGNGANGTILVELFQVKPGDLGKLETERITDDNPVHYIDAWVGEHLGNGGRPYKEKLETNVYRFRTTNGNYAVKETETSNEILLDFVGNNVGTGEEIYLEQDDPNKTVARTAEFRTITNGAPERDQITVSQKDQSTLQVRGNQKFGSLVHWTNCCASPTATTLIEWKDGLIVTNGTRNFTVGECNEVPS